MEKLTKDLLGQNLVAYIENAKTTGKVLAIADFGDRQQVCFQIKEGENGIWIPTFALVNSQESIILENQKEKSTKKGTSKKQSNLDKILEKNEIEETLVKSIVNEEKSEKEIASLAQKIAKEDLNLSLIFFDDLVIGVKTKVSADIETINKALEEAQKLIDKTKQDLIQFGQNNINIVNNYLDQILSNIKDLLSQIINTIQETWNQSLREVLRLITKDAKQYFDSAKRKIKYLRENYPHESDRSLAQRLTNHLMLISLKTGLLGVKIKPGMHFELDLESLNFSMELMIKINLLSISELLIKLIYGIAILHGYEKFEEIDIAEVICILALSLTIDSLKKLKLNSLTQGNPITHLFLNAISNIALFQLIGHSSYLFYDIKNINNPLISVKAYKNFITQTESYLNELLENKDKLAKVVQDVIKVQNSVQGLA